MKIQPYVHYNNHTKTYFKCSKRESKFPWRKRSFKSFKNNYSKVELHSTKTQIVLRILRARSRKCALIHYNKGYQVELMKRLEVRSYVIFKENSLSSFWYSTRQNIRRWSYTDLCFVYKILVTCRTLQFARHLNVAYCKLIGNLLQWLILIL